MYSAHLNIIKDYLMIPLIMLDFEVFFLEFSDLIQIITPLPAFHSLSCHSVVGLYHRNFIVYFSDTNFPRCPNSVLSPVLSFSFSRIEKHIDNSRLLCEHWLIVVSCGTERVE